MATLSLTIPNADVPDAMAAIEQVWKNDAVRLFFGNDQTAYGAATVTARAKALVAAWLVVSTKNYRTQRAQQAVQVGTEPVIT